jgi:hypothetical protein
MNKSWFCILIILITCGFIAPDTYRHVRHESFTAGELLEYRVHYGFINIGEGSVEVSPTLVRVNNRVCFKVSVVGKTSGTFDLGYKVRNTWRSYIDTSAIIPQQFYMNIAENKYRKEEVVYFDHSNKRVSAEEKKKQRKEFTIPDQVQDLISSLYFLRTIDFTKLHIGDTLEIPVFFDDTFYAFKIRYLGKGEAKTKYGKIKAIQLTPLIPANELFKDENAIRMWISDDLSKIPVKVEAELFIGAIELELKSFQGLKHPLHFY